MVNYEFYAPFAHVEGRYEVCRIRSESHGVFDTFIVLGESTSVPATVYVNSVLGQAFMDERFPECTTIRLPPSGLVIGEENQGRTVTLALESEEGPVTSATLRFVSSPQTMPKQVPYGGTGAPVWGSKFTCFGVDLNVDARVDGSIEGENPERLQAVPGIVTLGSFGRLEELPTQD